MNEEETLITSFVVPSKRRRLVDLLGNPKRRAKAIGALTHFKDLDSRWVVALSTDLQTPVSIEQELRSRGAGASCSLISENGEIDGKRLSLKAALEQVIGQGMGSILSCVPGNLVYFEGEEPSDRCLLVRISATR